VILNLGREKKNMTFLYLTCKEEGKETYMNGE